MAQPHSLDRSIAFEKGKEMGATHMFTMRQHMGCCGGRNESCERNFYVMPGENVNKAVSEQEGSLIEVYDLSAPMVFDHEREENRLFVTTM